MSELQAPANFMTSPDNLDTNLQSQRDELKNIKIEKSDFDMKEKVQEIESPSKKIKQKASPIANEIEDNEGMFNIFKETTVGERFLLFVGTSFAICIGAITPLFAETFGQVSSSLGPMSTRFSIYEDIRDVSVNLFSICLVQLLFSFIYTTCFVYVSIQMSIKMRNKFLQAILSQEQAWFDKQPDISGLATRLNIDCDQVQKGTGAKLAKIITDFSQMLVGFAYSFYKGWQLALVLSGLLPFCIGAGYWWIKRLQATNKLKKEAYTQAGGLAEEVLGNIKTVAAFNGQLKEYTKYENSLQQVLSKSLRNNFVFAIGGALFFFLFILVHCLTYFAGSHFIDLKLEIRGERYDAGVVLAVNLCMMIACFSLTMGLPCLKEFYDALSASKNLYSIINRKSQIDLYTGKIVEKLEGRIEFRDVCFKYENQENFVLDHFNLTIEAGQTFALCGPSGQGKSTVISLLQRFYDPNSGEILLDDLNIQLLNFSHVRNFISLVGQEPVLFSGTIEDNIRFGSLQATEEQIKLAAQQAQIHNFILSNKDGYKTFINAGGSNLSGGQKQRIAIARAIVKDPKILLLDEATSALDREGEKEVQKAINSVKYGRTVFIIAHRLVTIQNADKIGVINQGRIWQLGTHQSLMAEEGIYRSLAAADEMATKERKKKVKKEQIKQDEIFLQETKSLTSINETNEQQKNAISRSFGVIKNKLWFLVIGCLGACGNGCGYPMQGMLMIQSMETLSEFGDDYRKKNNMTSLFWFLLAIYLLLIFFTQVSCFGSFSEHLTDKLRRLSMQSVLYQDVGYFDHEKNSSVKVCQRLQDDCVKVNGAAGQVFGTIFMSLFAVFGGLAVCFIFCYWVGILMIVSIPINGLFIITAARIEFLGEVGNTSSQETSQIASEAIVNVKTVKSCNNEQYIAQKFAETLQKNSVNSQYKSCSSGIVLGMARFVMWGMFAMFFIFGAFIQRDDESFKFKETMIALMSAIFGFLAIGDTQIYAPDMIGGKEAASSIWKTIDQKPKLTGQQENKPQITGRIEFSKVDFKYPTRPDQQILKSFDLTIDENKTTALVGYSGNGKSTIISLILRYYEIESGTIIFNTSNGPQNLQDINIYHLRSQIGLVGQEPVLFQGTVADNIQYGREGDIEKVKECAQIANINLERCPLDKEVGLKGSHVSGGEKQRIAIARAIFANPKLMLLDEATSALDKETEIKVQDSIQAAFKNRTVVVIAHRLSTIKEADQICVINEGKVVEQGTHNALLSHEGLYYRLVRSMA